MKLASDPAIQEVLISGALILASYFAARLVSFLLGALFERMARRSAIADERMLTALKHPTTALLFLLGSWGAIHRLPAPDSLIARLDTALFLGGVLLVTIALMRALRLALAFYASQSHARDGGLALEFAPLMSRLGQIFLTLVAVIAVLQRLGVNVASLVVSLGVGSLAVGLAAQETLANMFAGFAIMIDRPFKIGDRIRLPSGEVGDVETIGIRATRLRTPDDTLLIVPNGALVKDRLVNQSRPTRHITTRVDVAVALGSDLAVVKGVLAEAARACPLVDGERSISALVTKFADSAVHFQLVFWAKDYLEQALAVSEVHEQIERRFREAGIELALPTRKVIQEGARPAPEEG